jgi:hypothetical protein
MNGDGARGRAAAREVLLEERIVERFEPVPEPNLKSMPSVFARPRIEGIVSCTELMKHGGDLRVLLDAAVEPDRAS